MATNGPNPHASFDHAVESLRGVRSAARVALVAQRLALVATALLLAAGALVLLDYFLRFPIWIRSFHLIVGIAALATLFVRLILPAALFRPSLTSLALRVESARPELSGSLASAVEFAEARERGAGPHESDVARSLERAVIERAAATFAAKPGGARHAGIVRLGALGRRSAQLAFVLASIAVAAIAAPDLSRIGFVRLAAPWAGASWPKRTGIVDATTTGVHPRGTALPLRAAVTRTHRDLDTTYAAVQRRSLDADGDPMGPTTTALLTHQRRRVELPGGESGALFERLVDADAPFVEYRFVSEDDATPWRRIRVVDPPEVLGATARITPPEYAAALGLAGAASASPVDAQLGTGLDERAHAGPALVGSQVEVTLTLNKPVPAPAEDAAWLSRTLGDDAVVAGARLEARGSEWVVRFTLADTVRMPITLVDEHGIGSVDEAVYRFEAQADREPSVSITEPAADVAVLPTATLRVAAEGRDEVALAQVWLEQQVARPLGARQPSGPGGALEPLADPAELVRIGAESKRSARVELELPLETLGVKPGDEVRLTAYATDALGAYIPAGEPGARAPSRSSVRTLRIISEAELIEEIRAELNAVRQTAIRIDAQQGDVADQTAARGSDRRTRAGQSQVGERLARQGESLQRLAQRAERNGLDDERLGAMLSQAAQATSRAGQASGEASSELEQAAAEQGKADASREGNEDAENEAGARAGAEAAATLSEARQEEVAEEQQRVRDELASLIEALDAGQDGWVARRQIESLLREQGENREATRKAGASAAGMSAEQLSPQQREALQQVADKQAEMAEEARRLAEDLPQRAEQVRKQDPAAAAGMEQAARSARNNQVAQKMDQAGAQASQNQTGDAARTQQQAMDALQEMLEELDKGERSRQEQLRRQLASLMASIEALIASQRTELVRLDEVAPEAAPAEPEIVEDREEGPDEAAHAPEAAPPAAAATAAPASLAGLDAGMISLARNTAGALDQAQGAGREAAPVARALARAGEAQSASIPPLRANQPTPARRAEQHSLSRLEEALAAAKEADQQQAQAESQQKRNELRRAYSALLERQVSARDRAIPFAEVVEPSRRDRAAIRAIGDEQVSIREALAELQRNNKEIAEAGVFEYAHRRLDAATSGAGDALREAQVPRALPHQARAIKGLRDLLASLADSNQKKKDFNEGQAGSGGSGSGSGQPPPAIPPLAQLRLLRAIQSDIAQDTRAASEARATPEELARLAADQREVADRGEALLEELVNQNKPTPADLLRKPDQPEGDAPAPPAEPEGGAEPGPEGGPL